MFWRYKPDDTDVRFYVTTVTAMCQQSNCLCFVEVNGSIWAPSSEFVSSSIPSWQISTAHAQPFRGARDLAFCLKVPLDSLLVWASSEGSGETARMRRLAWTFAARIGDKYQIRLTRSIYKTNLVRTKSFSYLGQDQIWFCKRNLKFRSKRVRTKAGPAAMCKDHGPIKFGTV